MTTLQKLRFIREECFQDLNEWERDFVDQMYDGVDGVPDNTNDEDLSEYLTRRQMEKIDEIWEELWL